MKQESMEMYKNMVSDGAEILSVFSDMNGGLRMLDILCELLVDGDKKGSPAGLPLTIRLNCAIKDLNLGNHIPQSIFTHH